MALRQFRRQLHRPPLYPRGGPAPGRQGPAARRRRSLCGIPAEMAGGQGVRLGGADGQGGVRHRRAALETGGQHPEHPGAEGAGGREAAQDHHRRRHRPVRLQRGAQGPAGVPEGPAGGDHGLPAPGGAEADHREGRHRLWRHDPGGAGRVCPRFAGNGGGVLRPGHLFRPAAGGAGPGGGQLRHGAADLHGQAGPGCGRR